MICTISMPLDIIGECRQAIDNIFMCFVTSNLPVEGYNVLDNSEDLGKYGIVEYLDVMTDRLKANILMYRNDDLTKSYRKYMYDNMLLWESDSESEEEDSDDDNESDDNEDDRSDSDDESEDNGLNDFPTLFPFVFEPKWDRDDDPVKWEKERGDRIQEYLEMSRHQKDDFIRTGYENLIPSIEDVVYEIFPIVSRLRYESSEIVVNSAIDHIYNLLWKQ